MTADTDVEALEAAQRILDYWGVPEGRMPRAPHSLDEVAVARALIAMSADPGRKAMESALPPGRTKQDVVNLVDLALSDALLSLGPGEGSRYDYDIFVEKLRVNGLCITALSRSRGGEK